MIRFTTAGESHGRALVALLEGVPAGLTVAAADINADLARRMRGHGRGARMKIEADRAEILSGVRHGETIGSPIALLIANRDWANWEDVMSPGARDEPPRRISDTQRRRASALREGSVSRVSCESSTDRYRPRPAVRPDHGRGTRKIWECRAGSRDR